MVSIGPYTESYDYKHMYLQPDLCDRTMNVMPCKKPNSLHPNENINFYRKKVLYYGDSIMGFLDQTPGFKKFSTLIRTAQMESVLSELQANVTMFIVPDEYLKFSVDFFQTMDIGTARRIVNFCTINRKIDLLLLSASPSQSFVTHYPANNLRIMTIDGI